MSSPNSTCWTVLRDAAAGAGGARDVFARTYEPVVRAYLTARWNGSPVAPELDDAVQEVFVECLRHGGALERVRPDRPGGFRAFLFGLVRNVALRFEQRRARAHALHKPAPVEVETLPARDDSLSRVYDRAWARAVVRQAAARQAERAEALGSAALRRVELLRLRFHDGLPIREIARLWDCDPATLHREYVRARAEFKAALLEVVAFHHLGSPRQAERECAELLTLLD
jgi:RNA polymerase sigma-70 factor (ECF subfamily)